MSDDLDSPAQKHSFPDEPPGWQSPGDWDGLLYSILGNNCTPFLGAGASASVLPLGSTISTMWAKDYGYPFPNADNLPRVLQFVSLTKSANLIKDRLAAEFAGRCPDFTDLDEPHRAMADLRLPIYITTNYDDFMMQALKGPKRDPHREYCRWRFARETAKSALRNVSNIFEATPERPIVFHLHGHLEERESMVLTEDDYIEFLINISEFEVIPPHILPAFAPSRTFLFVGYSLEDINFKVLFLKFAKQQDTTAGPRHFAVQLPITKDLTPAEEKARREYMEKLFENMKVKVYWGDAKQFTSSLRKRWAEFKPRQSKVGGGNGSH
jgi:hypothetical protein